MVQKNPNLSRIRDSGRLNCQSREVDFVVVSGDFETLESTINQLDQSSTTHVTLIENQINNLDYLAQKVSYAYVILNADLEESLLKLTSVIASLPLTDNDLPRISPQKAGELYSLMKKARSIFVRYNLQYWAIDGTLLGMARHKGLIPWDDDIDLAILAKDIFRLRKLQTALNQKGLKLFYDKTLDYFKIFPVNGKPIPKPSGEGFFEWKYPFIDIFPLIKLNKKFTHRGRIWQTSFPNAFFFPKELISTKMKFGPLVLPAPKGYFNYLNRMYGQEWNRVAYVQYDHSQETHLNRIKVDLINHSPPPYVLPAHH